MKKLWSPGEIAARLGVGVHRVRYILGQHPEIEPVDRVAGCRVFDQAAVNAIREQFDQQAERRELSNRRPESCAIVVPAGPKEAGDG